MTETLCKNCHHPVQDNYCSHCGQKTSTARFSFGQLFHELIHGVFHVDHGILFTAKELLVRPGTTVKNYLAGERVRYFNPFTFCVIIGGLNAYFLQKVHWQGLFIDLDLLNKQDVNQVVWEGSLKYFTYRLLLSIPVLSVVTYLFYYRRYLFIEHLIANTYLRAEFWLLMILAEPIELIGHAHQMAVVMRVVFLFAGLLYMGWAYAGLFSESAFNKRDLLKGFFVALIATLCDMLLMNILIRFF